MSNPVYLFPKSGSNNPPPPPPPHVSLPLRSVALNQPMAGQPNTVFTNATVLSRPMLVQPMATAATTSTPPPPPSSSAVVLQSMTPSAEVCKLADFFKQLMGLSKPASTHDAVVRLIQQLVNVELDSTTFVTNMSLHLKSASAPPTLAHFINESIDALRTDLALGKLSIPGIQPPPRSVVVGSSTSSSGDISLASVVLPTGAGALQVRPSTVPLTTIPICASTTRLAPPPPVVGVSNNPSNSNSSLLPPRIVGTVVTPRSVLPSVANNGATFRPQQQPLLAPAPPRTVASQFCLASTNPSAARLRLAQPIFPSSPQQPQLTFSTTPSSLMRLPTPTHPRPSTVPQLTNVRAPLPTSLIRPKQLQALPGSAAAIMRLPVTTTNSSTTNSHVTTTATDDDSNFFTPDKVRAILTAKGYKDMKDETMVCISQAAHSLTRSVLAKLSLIVSNRMQRLDLDPRLRETDNVKGQLDFLAAIDAHQKQRKFDEEREAILKGAKSRSRIENPMQAWLREKARQITSEQYERDKLHQADMTALSAIGPQKKRKSDESAATAPSESQQPWNSSSVSQPTSESTTKLVIVGPTGSDSISTSGDRVTLPSVRTHVASLRDVQVVMAKDAVLKRSRTYYSTYWRAP